MYKKYPSFPILTRSGGFYRLDKASHTKKFVFQISEIIIQLNGMILLVFDEDNEDTCSMSIEVCFLRDKSRDIVDDKEVIASSC